MNKVLQYISNIWKARDIREKIIFSFAVLVVFRVLASIPVVGVPANSIKQLFSGDGYGDILSVVSGGVLETASVVAIGLVPYINASVILQLLSSVIPKLEQLRKEGSQGRRIISMWTRILTVPLAILQSFVIYSALRYGGSNGQALISNLSALELVTMSATFTGGAVLMMWFGELIGESGLGGGSSYLIFLGIIANVPGYIQKNSMTMDNVEIVTFVVLYILILAAVILVTEIEKRIKIMYSRRVRTGASYENYLPLKLTQFGVMPVIFASSMLTFPIYLANFIAQRNVSDNIKEIANKVYTALNNVYVQNIGLFLLIIAFSFFYLTVVFNTDEYADNLQKQGAFIPGIRPGKATSDYLRKESFKLTVVGSIFLAFIAVLPNLIKMAGIINTPIISGTGFLIAVGTVMEMKRQIESMVVVRSYDKYL